MGMRERRRGDRLRGHRSCVREHDGGLFVAGLRRVAVETPHRLVVMTVRCSVVMVPRRVGSANSW